MPLGLGALGALAAALGVVELTMRRPFAARRAKDEANLLHLHTRMAAELAAERAATQTARAMAKSEAAAAARERDARAHLARAIVAALRALAEGDLTARLNTPGFTSEFAAARGLYGKTLFALACSASAIGGRARDIAREAEALAERARAQEARLALERAVLRQAIIDERQRSRLVEPGQSDAIEDAKATAARARIGALAERIDGFALQSRILALNVGIEAARAGDAGRGIAVIGQELRALSQRSSEATRDLTQALGALGANVAREGAPQMLQQPLGLRDLVAPVEAALAAACADAALDLQASESTAAGARAIGALAAKLDALASHFRLPGPQARPAPAPRAEPQRRRA